MGKNIGFVSTRFAGTDGVSLESSKWAELLKKGGHSCFWFAGVLDRVPEKSFLVPEAYFQHEKITGSMSRFSEKTAGTECDRNDS